MRGTLQLQSWACLRHTWLPDAAPASSGQPYPGKIWQVHSASAWSALTLGADPWSRGSPEPETALKGEENTSHGTACLEICWRWHLTLLFVMFLPIWLMLVWAAVNIQDTTGCFCTWFNTDCLQPIHRLLEQNLGVGNGLSRSGPTTRSRLVSLAHVLVIAGHLLTYSDGCERKLSTF